MGIGDSSHRGSGRLSLGAELISVTERSESLKQAKKLECGLVGEYLARLKNPAKKIGREGVREKDVPSSGLRNDIRDARESLASHTNCWV